MLNKRLGLQSKLLMMQLDKQESIINNKEHLLAERRKSLSKLMDVYGMLIKPYLEGEKCRKGVLEGMESERGSLEAALERGESITDKVSWIKGHAFEILTTRKTKMEKITERWC